MYLRRMDQLEAQPIRGTTEDPLDPVISPDGQWVAYQSDESGQPEVYVRPFPAVHTGRWQISTSGGSHPAWSRTGRELFYVAADSHLMAVAVQ